jgi:hypothetical protein
MACYRESLKKIIYLDDRYIIGNFKIASGICWASGEPTITLTE